MAGDRKIRLLNSNITETMLSTFAILVLIGSINVAHAQEKRKDFLEILTYECEGKDASNLTYVSQWSKDANCNEGSDSSAFDDLLIDGQRDGSKSINTLRYLAWQNLPSGQNYVFETLKIVTSGNLAGKYVYIKEVALIEKYLKKCSSVLAKAYTSVQNHVALISDKLDLNTLVNPNGAFELFKKSTTTICKGTGVYA